MKNIPISAMIGLFFTGIYFLMAVFAPWIAPYGMAEVVGDVWEPSSSEFLLGTDSIGRDLLSRMIYGGQTTIFIATAATILSFTLGSVMGFFAAVSGGWVDQTLSRFVDLIMSIPSLIFALVVLSVMPTTVPILILLMGLLDSTRVFRLARAVAVDITVMDYVEAARLRGEKPPQADWGGIVKENKEGINYGIQAALYPAYAIATLCISINLVADWILNRTTSLKGGRG